jgi:O-antigen ligase
MRREQHSRAIPIMLLAILTGSTLLILPYSVSDPINLPKMVFMTIGVLTTLGLLMTFNGLEVKKNSLAFSLVLIGFCIGLILQLLTSSGSKSETFYGIPGRNTGVLTYFAFVFIALTSYVVADRWLFKMMFNLIAILGLLLSVYGVLQKLGKEPFPYVNVYESNVFGTFGNPNFQSAFLGVVAVLAFSRLVSPTAEIIARTFHLALLGFSLVGVFLTNSIQGFFNFAIGSSIFILLLLYSKKLFRLAIVYALLIVLGLANIALAFFQIGPLSALIYKGSMSARVYYWETAIRIWSDFPIFGVGLDQYGDWLRFYRTTEEVQRNITADSAHSVYLDLLSGGGLTLFVPYVFMTLLAIRSITRVMRRSETPSVEFLILVGLWTAHQAQSLISIGHIGVAIWGWVFTGLIVGYESNTREGPAGKELKKSSANQKSIQMASTSPQAVLGLFLGLVCGCALALPPLVSSSKYYNSFKTSDARVIQAATYLEPLNRNSFIQVSSILKANKFDAEALEVAKKGVENFPRSFSLWRVLRDIAPVGSREHTEAINKLHDLDPKNPEFFRD